jgi:hypothetical protein
MAIATLLLELNEAQSNRRKVLHVQVESVTLAANSRSGAASDSDQNVDCVADFYPSC